MLLARLLGLLAEEGFPGVCLDKTDGRVVVVEHVFVCFVQIWLRHDSVRPFIMVRVLLIM